MRAHSESYRSEPLDTDSDSFELEWRKLKDTDRKVWNDFYINNSDVDIFQRYYYVVSNWRYSHPLAKPSLKEMTAERIFNELERRHRSVLFPFLLKDGNRLARIPYEIKEPITATPISIVQPVAGRNITEFKFFEVGAIYRDSHIPDELNVIV